MNGHLNVFMVMSVIVANNIIKDTCNFPVFVCLATLPYLYVLRRSPICMSCNCPLFVCLAMSHICLYCNCPLFACIATVHVFECFCNLPLFVCLATVPYLYVLQPSPICPPARQPAWTDHMEII